jgi:hypothetical protein
MTNPSKSAPMIVEYVNDGLAPDGCMPVVTCHSKQGHSLTSPADCGGAPQRG